MTQDARNPVAIRTATYQGWQAYRIENGSLALVLVPQIGGRVMSILKPGSTIAHGFRMLGSCLNRCSGMPITLDSTPKKREAMGKPWGTSRKPSRTWP